MVRRGYFSAPPIGFPVPNQTLLRAVTGTLTASSPYFASWKNLLLVIVLFLTTYRPLARYGV
jgi:hypothetical protein